MPYDKCHESTLGYIFLRSAYVSVIPEARRATGLAAWVTAARTKTDRRVQKFMFTDKEKWWQYEEWGTNSDYL